MAFFCLRYTTAAMDYEAYTKALAQGDVATLRRLDFNLKTFSKRSAEKYKGLEINTTSKFFEANFGSNKALESFICCNQFRDSHLSEDFERGTLLHLSLIHI